MHSLIAFNCTYKTFSACILCLVQNVFFFCQVSTQKFLHARNLSQFLHSANVWNTVQKNVATSVWNLKNAFIVRRQIQKVRLFTIPVSIFAKLRCSSGISFRFNSASNARDVCLLLMWKVHWILNEDAGGWMKRN